MVSAVNFQARPLKNTRAIKIARQKVLFMHAAPSSAASETVMVLRVFFAAYLRRSGRRRLGRGAASTSRADHASGVCAHLGCEPICGCVCAHLGAPNASAVRARNARWPPACSGAYVRLAISSEALEARGARTNET